jgi:hypothetical protein
MEKVSELLYYFGVCDRWAESVEYGKGDIFVFGTALGEEVFHEEGNEQLGNDGMSATEAVEDA